MLKWVPSISCWRMPGLVYSSSVQTLTVHYQYSSPGQSRAVPQYPPTSHRIKKNFQLAKCHFLNSPWRAWPDRLMFRYDGGPGGQDQQGAGGGAGGGGVPGGGPHCSAQYNARPGKTI